jgi:hypothetical protein
MAGKRKTLNKDSAAELQKIIDKEPDFYYHLLSAFKPNPYEVSETALCAFFDDQLEFFQMFDAMVEEIKTNSSSPLVVLEKFASLGLSNVQMLEFSSWLFRFFAVYENYKKDWVKNAQCLKHITEYAENPDYDLFGLKLTEDTLEMDDYKTSPKDRFTKKECIALLEELIFSQPTFKKTTNATKARFISKLTGFSVEKLEQEIGYYKNRANRDTDPLIEDWREKFAKKSDGRKR